MKGFHPIACIRVSLLYGTVEIIRPVAPIVGQDPVKDLGIWLKGVLRVLLYQFLQILVKSVRPLNETR